MTNVHFKIEPPVSLKIDEPIFKYLINKTRFTHKATKNIRNPIYEVVNWNGIRLVRNGLRKEFYE